MKKHRGIRIVPIKIVRYEVRDLTGKRLKAFASRSQAQSWIDGFDAAAKIAQRAAGVTKEK